jgi:hypothetical protein
MPALVYPTGNFQPFTKILSSEVNGKFNSITTLLNTTKLDSTNVQQGGLTYDRLAVQTSVQVVVTDTLGVATVAQFLPVVNGGLGFSYAATTADIGKVLVVNEAGTALTFSGAVDSTYRLYSLNHFT